MSDRDERTPGRVERQEENNDRLGEANIRDEGVPGELREEMFENARLLNTFDDTIETNVNDEPGFDDGVPGSISDFSVVTGREENDSTTRLADPNDDAGGEVRGPRVGGDGAFDGGPERDHPLGGEHKKR